MKKLALLFILLSLTTFLACPALANTSIPGCPDIHRDLSFTDPLMKGHNVAELQERLAELGFDPKIVAGIFGLKTHEALIKFQLKYKMSPTGHATLEVWDKLTQNVQLPAAAAAAAEKLEKPKGYISIVINTDKKTLTVYDDDNVHIVLPVAVGKYKTPTPVGEWRIVHKSTNWGGGFGSRWLGLNVPWGIFGIHGTNKPYSISTNASHGCIRMFNRDVERLYSIIPLGTPVSIVSDAYPEYPPGFKDRHLKKGMSGPDVVQMQLSLKRAGILMGRADGRFGIGTEIFVRRYQALTGEEITGEFAKDDYKTLDQLLDHLAETEED
jgi:lipoprotein-anchoring transpeptidase ErfK/SrfK